MGPLVIVANVGANDAFYNSARIRKENRLYFDFSVRTMIAFVEEDERTFVARLPLEQQPNPYPLLSPEWFRIFQLNYFKSVLQGAASLGKLDTTVRTATVFGGAGSGFKIPKDYLAEHVPGIDSLTLARLPSELTLTNGTNQNIAIALVPQLTIGALYNTELLVRYIPPVVLDVNIGKFSFFGVAVSHAFTNWLQDEPFHAAVQIGFQHSTIRNEVGLTKAKLEANTDLFAVNLHASRKWDWIEPYIGVSFERLNSDGSYTFTLPQDVKDQIGYDISPQRVPVTLSDNAFKGTVGVTAWYQSFYAFASTGIAKHLIFSAGAGYSFDILRTQ